MQWGSMRRTSSKSDLHVHNYINIIHTYCMLTQIRQSFICICMSAYSPSDLQAQDPSTKNVMVSHRTASVYTHTHIIYTDREDMYI